MIVLTSEGDRHPFATDLAVAHVLPRIAYGGLLEHVHAAAQVVSQSKSIVISIFEGDDEEAASYLPLDVVRLSIPLAKYRSEEFVTDALAQAISCRQIALLHSYHFFTDVYALPAAQLLQMPSVQTIAGIPQRRWEDIFAYRTQWNLSEKEIEKALTLLALPRATLPVSRFVERKWRSYGLSHDRVRRSYLGTKIDIRPVPLSRDANSLEILFLHRIEPVKISDALLPALEIVASSGLNVQLTLIRYGDFADNFIREVRGLGIVVRTLEKSHHIWEDIEHADCLLLASRSEGLPLTILEAMARELPVIATDVGGTGEAVRDGKTGFLVSSDSSASIADAVFKLAGKREEARVMGRRARQSVIKRFDRVKHLQELVEVYRACVDR